MVQILTHYPIDDILENPKDYISEDFDKPLLQFIHHDVSNPVILMLGCNETTNIYYFTLEDNDTSEDFYCFDGNLTKMFNEIMEGKGEYEVWVKG
jgi:hypothetical protein